MYVYVISNPAFEGWLKVGKTKNLNARMSTLQTGAPTDYQVELLIEFFDDRPLHNKLEAQGYERSKEWFKAELSDVRRVILETVDEWKEGNIQEIDGASARHSSGKFQAEVDSQVMH